MKKVITIAALILTAITGTAIAASNYDLSIKAPSAKVNAKSAAQISIQPKGDFHMNMDYPTKLTLVAPDGVTLEKTKQTSKDAAKFDKNAAEFKVEFTSASAGKKSFTGELKFAVCSETTCDPKVEKIAFDVEVK